MIQIMNNDTFVYSIVSNETLKRSMQDEEINIHNTKGRVMAVFIPYK